MESVLQIFHLHLHAMSLYKCPLFNAIFLFSDPSFLITASSFTFKKYLLMNITSPFLGIKMFELCTFTLQSIFQEWVSHTNQCALTLLCCGLISLFFIFLQPLSLDEESVVLAGKEVRVEKRVVFRLDLPNRKTVGVKAKPGKLLGEVLRPILHKYGYKLEFVTLCLVSIIINIVLYCNICLC